MDPGLPFSPAAQRNQGPIQQALSGLWPGQARVLEVASGTGQHAAHFVAAQPGWQWQPTEAEPSALVAIDARCADLPNVAPALLLDVLAPWPAAIGEVDAVFNANMLHISPWATCAALMRGAAVHLKPGGCLALYGPFRVDGEPTVESNEAFDADLRARNPAWGLRHLEKVRREANQAGLHFERVVPMPANNLIVVFRRAIPEEFQGDQAGSAAKAQVKRT